VVGYMFLLERLLHGGGWLWIYSGVRVGTTRAHAMQKACELKPSTMAAILALSNEKVEEICGEIDGIVVPANYNCNGQVVISGEIEAVGKACDKCLEAGAKRAVLLQVGGAFHSPLMEPARLELADGIERTEINTPICPVYQNVTAQPTTDPEVIKANLLAQLTSPVKWTQSVENMLDDGADYFMELGPGTVLQGLVRKIAGAASTVTVEGMSSF
ncbi:MAG: ACP S-malonyltransferase, partial [Bacteroidales bacterium]|nr:ACP S-malonyltransferase [Bacteroidales bacterium]